MVKAGKMRLIETIPGEAGPFSFSLNFLNGQKIFNILVALVKFLL